MPVAGPDESNLSRFRITPNPETGEVHLSWRSTRAQGQWFQVYRNRQLAWSGTQRYIDMPGGRADYHLVEVVASEARLDFSSSLTLPPGTGARVVLSWYGGRYLVPTNHDLVGFNVYGEPTPGGGIDYSTPVGFVPATLGPVPVDGFGVGRFGRGRFGYAEVQYRWTSGRLSAAGTWNHGTKSIDSAGTEATVSTMSVVITIPPNPPAAASDGSRLRAVTGPGPSQITLSWNAAP